MNLLFLQKEIKISESLVFYEQSVLALAAYSNLSAGISEDKYTDALEDGGDGMSAAQAAAFADRYTVVDQYTDPASGFSATVFEDALGKRTLAIRGTQVSEGMDLIADIDLMLSGAASRQIVALYNYVQRLQGTINQDVAQLEWDELNSTWALNPAGEYVTSAT